MLNIQNKGFGGDEEGGRRKEIAFNHDATPPHNYMLYTRVKIKEKNHGLVKFIYQSLSSSN